MADETATAAGMGKANIMTMYPWWLVLIQGLAALILGIALLAWPYRTLMLMVIFLGAYWFVTGIFSIISIFSNPENKGWKILTGILGIIAGAVILIYPYYSSVLLPALLVLFIGFWGLIIGCTQLAAAFPKKDWAMAIIGIFAIILGLLIISEPVISTAMLPFVLGIFGVFGGVIIMIFAFKAKGAQAATA